MSGRIVTARLKVLALVSVLCTAALAGCSADVAAPSDRDAPAFTGPFAAEYEEAWQKSETSEVRTVLRDGRISDQEWSQVLKTLTECLAEKGITLVEYDAGDGGYEANVGDMSGADANERMGACEKRSGEAWVGRLYRDQTRNPENVSETQLITECLIRNHAVPTSYTEEDYLEDAPTLSFPYLDDHGPQTFAGCNADPDYSH